MVQNALDRQLALREFEYGNHTIVVEVLMQTNGYTPSKKLYGSQNAPYMRKVSVQAYQTEQWEDETKSRENLGFDAKDYTFCAIEEDSNDSIVVPDNPSLSWYHRLLVRFSSEVSTEDMKSRIQNKRRKMKQQLSGGPAIELSKQIEETVRPVLEMLDSQYQVLNKDVEIDVSVSVERMAAETSWVDVEDEMERISNEIDAIAEM